MRGLIFFIIKAAVSGLLLFLAVRLVNFEPVKERLSQVEPGWLVLGFLVLLLQILIAGLRWRMIAFRCGASLSVGLALRFSMIGQFFNQTLPSSVGGDATRIWLLGRRTGWRAATYSVLLDRVVGVVALAILVTICLPGSLPMVRNTIGRSALLVIGLGCIGAGVVFVSLASKRLIILQRWPLTRDLAAAADIALLILRSPSLLTEILALSIFIHILTALAAWCAVRAIGADTPLLSLLFLVPPVTLITIVPISIAGWGVRESAMIAAFAYAGLPQSEGLVLSLLFGVGYLALGIIGGVIWLAFTDKERRLAPTKIGT